MSRECRGCTECCTVLAVEPLNKPPDKKCKHDTGRGCSIYGDYPEACRVFECWWLLGLGTKSARPDKTGMVVWGTALLGDQGEQLPTVRVNIRKGVRERHRRTWQWLLGASHLHPLEVVQGDRSELWQEGKMLAAWDKKDFIQTEIVNGKFVSVKVIPEEEVLITDSDRERWANNLARAKTVLEPGESLSGLMVETGGDNE